MAHFSAALPSTTRKSVDSVRLSAVTPARPYLVALPTSKQQRKIAGPNPLAHFVRLPQESEDARITGDTRSLNRRLLGLNIQGTLGGRLTA